MTDTRGDHECVADQLADAIEALQAVDLNPLYDAEVRTLLDAKADLQEVCLDQRQRQHYASEQRDDGEVEPDAEGSA